MTMTIREWIALLRARREVSSRPPPPSPARATPLAAQRFTFGGAERVRPGVVGGSVR
jgi:hypothetical protein